MAHIPVFYVRYLDIGIGENNRFAIKLYEDN